MAVSAELDARSALHPGEEPRVCSE